MAKVTSASEHIKTYSQKLARALELPAMDGVPVLAQALREAWQCGRSVYLCGNGGSAANAIHLANDLLYGAGISNGAGLKVEALTANPAVITSLANDVGFADIFAEQLRVKALETGNAKGMRTFAILGYAGGRAKAIAQHPIHFAIDDMQVCEDLQLAVGHMCMQWLLANPIRADARQTIAS